MKNLATFLFEKLVTLFAASKRLSGRLHDASFWCEILLTISVVNVIKLFWRKYGKYRFPPKLKQQE